MRRLRRLLRAVLPPGPRGDHLLRELEREYTARRERGHRSRLWLLRESLSLTLHYGARRVRRTLAAGAVPTADLLLHHLRMGLRRLRREPGFAAVSVLTLALGIGSTVAIGSVVSAVLLEPLPYEDPDELVALWEWNRPRDRPRNVANPGNFKDWRDRSETVGSMAALTLPQPLVLTGLEAPREAMTVLTTPGVFRLLGVEAVLGRTFSEDAGERDGRESVLSHGFWMEAFGGDPGVVGETLTIQGESTVVVGVLPPTYIPFGEGADLFASYRASGDQTSTGRFLYVVGRLAPGATVERARTEMTAIADALEAEYPDFNGGWGVRVVPLDRELRGEAGPALWTLLAAVSLLLLVACANVANLLLARAADRGREMAVRASLGASRETLVGQLLVESLVLAGTGTLVGVAGAWGTVRVAAAHLPAVFDLPAIHRIEVDAPILLVAAVLGLGTGLLFGLAPALQAGSRGTAGVLARRSAGAGRAAGRARRALVVAEVALSVVLLVGASLLGRSLVALTRVDSGIDSAGSVLTARVSLSGPAYEEDGAQLRFFERLVEGVSGVPGVVEAGAVTFLPMDGPGAATSFHPGADPAIPRPEWPAADVRHVAGDYFRTMGIEGVRGRTFDARDRPAAVPVVVVNRTLARTHWPDENPVGKTLTLSWGELQELEVVGVVEDVRLTGPAEEPRGTVYLPYAQSPAFRSMALVVRSRVPPLGLVPELTEQVAALDPGLPLSRVRPMSSILSRAVARPRAVTVAMGAFATVTCLLALLGVYGVLAYTVSRRVREFGVRRALGAAPGSILARVVRQGMTWVVAGLVLGTALAWGMSGLLESLLYQVEPRDPLSVAAVTGLLLAAGAVACAFPAWRALRAAPAAALRTE